MIEGPDGARFVKIMPENPRGARAPEGAMPGKFAKGHGAVARGAFASGDVRRLRRVQPARSRFQTRQSSRTIEYATNSVVRFRIVYVDCVT